MKLDHIKKKYIYFTIYITQSDKINNNNIFLNKLLYIYTYITIINYILTYIYHIYHIHNPNKHIGSNLREE